MNSNINFINAYMAFFIIHTVQIGIGILGVPKIIYQVSKKDAWISILIAGLLVSFLIWIMINILKQHEDCNIYEIHEKVFGRFLGSLINIFIVVFFMAELYSVIIGYVELSLTWGYEGVYEWIGTLALLLITIYAVSGGFRVIAGICYLSFLMTIWLLFVMYQPLEFIHFNRILPVLSSPPSDVIKGVYKSSYTLLGFETLFFIYPFIKEKKKLHFFTQLAAWFSTFLVLLATMISIMFFSAAELEKQFWPVVSMIGSVNFPFIERFEFVAVPLWILVIFPNLCIILFIAAKGIKQVFHVKLKHGIWVISLLIFFTSFFLTNRMDTNILFDRVGQVGFYLWFVYPIFLFLFSRVKSKIYKRLKWG
ncbi:GerAB/ArcD/ProY family transporter [Bacillus massiliglaciei]|uniref:GerAB/ArcD/ProY family transporter n=1 Tax=Bacillus massiliglaciei TaxID=1816693 RepID=UPI000AE40E06|nr:GerAB/ArcD/ProY family transporter [Bacillus massiliglaciei]